MKWYGYVIIGLLLTSCGFDVNSDANYRMTQMKSPVILIGIREGEFGHSISVKDSTGRIETFGNGTILGVTIGASRHIGDTIK